MNLKGIVKLVKLMQEHRLTVIQWQILLVVAENPGSSITGLVKADKLICGTPSDIAVTVKRLGEGRHDRPGLGLIKKEKLKTDGRYFKLTLSAKGKRFVDKFKTKIKGIR